jgi:multicomponent Na+:H+ antiporter subunit E
MVRFISLTLVLFAFWLALSGHYAPVLVAAGLASACFCAVAARRMRSLDDEGHPLYLVLGALTYYPWLVWEIVKSAWSVTKIILHPALPISPTITRIRATQRGAAAIATYANSITLTPGTLTIGVNGNELIVHALTRNGALDLEAGHMDRRVTQFEGGN